MTKDEIKATPLSEILRTRYGIEANRAGMIRCPFHPDKNPSMKLYRDSAYCFACHWSGDVFRFVQDYEGTSFKEAFQSLGGTYDSSPAEITKAVKKTIFRREIASLRQEVDKERYQEASRMLTMLRELPEAEIPFSTAWCAIQECLVKLKEMESDRTERNKQGRGEAAGKTP